MNLENEKSVLTEKENQEVEGDSCANLTDGEKIDIVAARILREYRAAFEELAK